MSATAGIKTIVVKPVMSPEEAKRLEGQFIDSFDHVVNYDADVYYEEAGEQRLLFHFRKGVIPDEMLETALSVFKREAVKASSIRGKASGAVDASRLSRNIDNVVSPGKFRSRVQFKDGTESNYYVSNKVNSLIAGYFDKPKLIHRHQVLTEGLVPCRTTSFTEKNDKDWHRVSPLITHCDSLYSQLEPKRHMEQHALASMTPQYEIGNTAFSTVTVNYNWRTACHLDSGDYHNGYSVILVAEQGNYRGGYLGYPRFGVCVDVRHGDFLLKDPHQYHCNTPLVGESPSWTRLSMIMYYRENMQQCYQPATQPKIQAKKIIAIKKRPIDTKYTLTPVRVPKKNIDLGVYIRPDTTDIKVIEEVLQRNVYEKPMLDFYIEPGECWLDLGGNIGTFSLMALSRGASVVTCEPETENLHLLKMNLEHNFGQSGSYEVLPVAVTADSASTVDLYICKGEYNKYRHTIFPKRGRQHVSVAQRHINKLLQEYSFDGIKIDIEGAEIPILEYLTADHYQKAGIKKLCFEYSFDIDPSIPRFLKIVARLRDYFSIVSYSKVKEDELVYKHFPAATMVYCKI